MATGFQLPFGIQPVNALPVDFYSGPYSGTTVSEAIDLANFSIPSYLRFLSMSVRLIVEDKSLLYWYYSGITDSDLVLYGGRDGATGESGSSGTSGTSGTSVTGTTDDDFYYDITGDTLHVPNIVLSGKIQERTTLFTGITTNTTVVQFTSTDYNGGYFDYYVKDGNNKRTGTVMGVWEGSSVEYTDFSTADLGDTSPIEFTIDINSGIIRLNAIITSGAWTIQTGVRVI